MRIFENLRYLDAALIVTPDANSKLVLIQLQDNIKSPPSTPPAAYADLTASPETNHIQSITSLTSPQEEDTGLSEQGNNNGELNKTPLLAPLL